MPANVSNIDSIFSAAAEISTPQERAAFVQSHCGGDEELKRRIEKLLAAHLQAGSFLEAPPAQFQRTAAAAIQEGPGSIIGPYKLLEQIGEGGMGIVFMAEQMQPIQRRVALKIIKPGMDTRQVIARFEAERQALALMDHPNIARVLDAGTTGQAESGRWSVVGGQPDKSGRWSVASGQPATAGSAHLTPDSCLPTPVPQLSTDHRPPTPATSPLSTDHRPLTTAPAGRPYFVMELVRGVPVTEYCDNHRLSIRERLELFITICQAVQHAHQKGIIHRDLKPTNILVTQHDGKPLAKVIDFGVAKATGQKLTEKTLFTGFAQLIGTPLYMSPEQAEMSEPDVDTRSDIYSLGVLLYELLTGSTPFEAERLKSAAFDEMRRIISEEEPPRPSTRLSSLSLRERAGVRGDGVSGAEARETAHLASTIAEHRRSDSRQLSRLFQGELDWIVMKALEKDRNRRYETASSLAADVEHYLADEPVQACPPSAMYRLRKFARRYKVGLLTAAVVLAALVVGTLVSTWQAVRAYRAEQFALSNAKRADEVSDFLVSAFRSPDPGRDGRSITIAEVLDRSVESLQSSFTDDPRTKAALLETIAESYLSLGLYQEATDLLEQIYQLRSRLQGHDHPATLHVMDSLTNALPQIGQYDKALLLAKQALELRIAKLGAGSPEALASMSELAGAYRYALRLPEVVQLDEKLVEFCQATAGANDIKTLRAMIDLAGAYMAVGRNDDAMQLIDRVLEAIKSQGDIEPHEAVQIRVSLAAKYYLAGQLQDALTLLEETVALSAATLGPNDGATLWAMSLLGPTYLDAGQYDNALRVSLETVNRKTETVGLNRPDTADSMIKLGNVYLALGRVDDAVQIHQQVLELRTKNMGPNNHLTIGAEDLLAYMLTMQGDLDAADALARDALRRARAVLAPDATQLGGATGRLAHVLLFEEQFEEAEMLARESLSIREKRQVQPNDWRICTAREMIGAALLGEKKYAEAELYLLSAYEGLCAREAFLPSERKRFLLEALQNLVELYKANDQPEKAAAFEVAKVKYAKTLTPKVSATSN